MSDNSTARTFLLMEQDEIECHAELLEDFMPKVLDLRAKDCLVTDESLLSDFVYDTQSEARALEAVELFYGVKLASASIRLVDLLERIELTLIERSRPH
jgi:hypothetical protein